MRNHEIIYMAFVWSMCLLLLAACSTLQTGRETESAKREFDRFQIEHPDKMFSSDVDQKVKDCLQAYRERVRLPNGRLYGDSVRRYSLSDKSVLQIKDDMERMQCRFKEDVIRDPVGHEPRTHQGSTIPLWIFLCPDGGVVRVKPIGDPTSDHRPQVHGSKSLRYPFDAKFENYSDEVVKVDGEGLAIPKSRKDLGPTHLMAGWGEDAHENLKGLNE